MEEYKRSGIEILLKEYQMLTKRLASFRIAQLTSKNKPKPSLIEELETQKRIYEKMLEEEVPDKALYEIININT